MGQDVWGSLTDLGEYADGVLCFWAHRDFGVVKGRGRIKLRFWINEMEVGSYGPLVRCSPTTDESRQAQLRIAKGQSVFKKYGIQPKKSFTSSLHQYT